MTCGQIGRFSTPYQCRASIAPLFVPTGDAILAEIDPDASDQVTLEFEGREGTFTPEGEFLLGGGFCPQSTCPFVISGFRLSSQEDPIAVGSGAKEATLEDLNIISREGVEARVPSTGGIVDFRGFPEANATGTIDGDVFSRKGSAGLQSGFVDLPNGVFEYSGRVVLSGADGEADFALVANIIDSPPVPVLDFDFVGECGAPFELRADASFDPDGDDIVRYDWFELDVPNDRSTPLGTGATLQRTFDVGRHVVGVVVTDERGRQGVGVGVFDIEDTLPPEIEEFAFEGPLCLWPPNHRYAVIRAERDFRAVITDLCDPDPELEFVSGSSDQPDNSIGDGDTTNDVVLFEDRVCLRAERQGMDLDGREYTIGVAATDDAGNRADPTVTVRVVHDQRDQDCTHFAEEEAADDGDPVCTPPPSGATAQSSASPSSSAGSTSSASADAGCGTVGVRATTGRSPVLAAMIGLLLVGLRRRRRKS